MNDSSRGPSLLFVITAELGRRVGGLRADGAEDRLAAENARLADRLRKLGPALAGMVQDLAEVRRENGALRRENAVLKRENVRLRALVGPNDVALAALPDLGGRTLILDAGPHSDRAICR